MAKFSQAFLQGLLRPTYEQGLFEAARGAGMAPGLAVLERQRKEKEAAATARNDSLFNAIRAGNSAYTAGNVDALNNSIVDIEKILADPTLTKDQRSKVQDVLLQQEALLPDARKNQIAAGAKKLLEIDALLQNPNLPEDRRVSLQQQKQSLESDSEISSAYLSASRKARADELSALETDSKITSRINGSIADRVVNNMLSSGSTEVPKTIQNADGSFFAIDAELRQEIQDTFVERSASNEAFQDMVDGGALEPEFVDWINNNAEVIDNNPALKAAVRVLNATEGKKTKERTAALTTIRTAVNKEAESQRATRRSKAAMQPVVNSVIENAIMQPDLVWGGGTLKDFFEDPAREDDVETFKEQATQYLLEGGEKTDEAILKAGMAGMRRFIPDEQLQRDRLAAQNEEKQLHEDNIADIMEDLNVDRLEAEAIYRNYLRQQAYDPLSKVSEFGAL